jgi:hypothetical protein
MKNHKYLYVGLVLVLLSLVSVYGIIVHSLTCDQRTSSVPRIPVYPNSLLVKEITIVDDKNGKIIELNYTSDNYYLDIIRFFKDSSQIICRDKDIENKVSCFGNGDPFGIYSVVISTESASKTSYLVEIKWDKCGNNREGVSFENR